MLAMVAPSVTTRAATADADFPRLIAYIGTYTGPKSEGIYAFRVDARTGATEPLGCVAHAVHPSFLALHPGGRFLYAVSEVNASADVPGGLVLAFAVDRKTGKLSLLNQQASGGAGPCHLTVDKTGRHVLVANYSGGSVAVLPIREDGSLGAATCVAQHQGASAHPQRQRQPHVHSVNLAPDNRYALVADLGTDHVMVYRFDAARGVLETPAAQVFKTPPGSGPRHLAFHPGGRRVLVLNELSSTLMLLDYDPATGRLAPLQTVSTLPEDFSGENTTAEVAVHPNGRWVFASNRGHDSLAVFALDPGLQRLERLDHVSTRGRTPRHFALDPAGRFLWAANQATHNLVLFRVDEATGRLQPTGQTHEVGSPVCIRFLPGEAPGN
jgi:6-phosphogluconolactonase